LRGSDAGEIQSYVTPIRVVVFSDDVGGGPDNVALGWSEKFCDGQHSKPPRRLEAAYAASCGVIP
jgi:hypothetical protein